MKTHLVMLSLLITTIGFGAQTREITLSRAAGDGAYPRYQVTLKSDGSVVYDGVENVRVVGRRTKQIDAAAFGRVWAKIEAVGFWDLQDRYDHVTIELSNGGQKTSTVPGLPEKWITVTDGEKTKRILDYLGAPNTLTELEALIDAVAGTSIWVEQKAPEPKPVAVERS